MHCYISNLFLNIFAIVNAEKSNIGLNKITINPFFSKRIRRENCGNLNIII